VRGDAQSTDVFESLAEKRRGGAVFRSEVEGKIDLGLPQKEETMSNPPRCHPILIGMMGSLALLSARGADARSFFCAAGDTPCVIQAINEANMSGHRNTIRLAAGTYTVSNADNDTDGWNALPSISSVLTIDVAGKGTAILTRDVNAPSFRLLHVAASGHLTLRGVSVSNGRVDSGAGGAGLFNAGGDVTIDECAFSDNAAIRSAAGPGGLLNSGGQVTITGSVFDRNVGVLGPGALGNTNEGTMRVVASQITNNFAGLEGGGLAVAGGSVSIAKTTFAGNSAAGAGTIWVFLGHLVVADSTFVGNRSTYGAAALMVNDGTVDVTNTTFARQVLTPAPLLPIPHVIINARGVLTLTNSTFFENTVSDVAVPPGAQVSLLSGGVNATTVLQNTILAHAITEPLLQDCRGSVTSLGNNVISEPVMCGITLQPGDLVGDPGLGAFTDDLTPGHGHFPLLRTSQAIDSGNDEVCPKRDQIGQLRKEPCDIGAIEFREKKRHDDGPKDDDQRR